MDNISVNKNPKSIKDVSNLSPMANDAITRGTGAVYKPGLGSPFYICDNLPCFGAKWNLTCTLSFISSPNQT